MPKIEILSGKREGDTVDLPETGIDIGNRKTAKLCISDPWISWNHAKIVSEEGKLVIVDLGSSNGTWVNGQKITRHPISDEDVIILGRTKIRVVGLGAPRDGGAEPGTKPAISPLNEVLQETSALSARLAQVERERDDLARMKEVLERFLDLSASERAAVSSLAAAEKPRAGELSLEMGFETMKLTPVKASLELEQKLDAVESRSKDLEKKLAAAESMARDLESKLSAASARKDDGIAERLAALEKELEASRSAAADAASRAAAASARAAAGDARLAQLDSAEARLKDAESKTKALESKLQESEEKAKLLEAKAPDSDVEAKALEAKVQELEGKTKGLDAKLKDAQRNGADLEAKVRDLEAKLASSPAASKKEGGGAPTEKLERDLENARKSAIDAEARAAKLERDLDNARRTTGRLGQGPEIDSLKADIAQARAERDDWKRQFEEVRGEIDRISVDQLEREESLRSKIAGLEKQLREKA